MFLAICSLRVSFAYMPTLGVSVDFYSHRYLMLFLGLESTFSFNHNFDFQQCFVHRFWQEGDPPAVPLVECKPKLHLSCPTTKPRTQPLVPSAEAQTNVTRRRFPAVDASSWRVLLSLNSIPWVLLNGRDNLDSWAATHCTILAMLDAVRDSTKRNKEDFSVKLV